MQLGGKPFTLHDVQHLYVYEEKAAVHFAHFLSIFSSFDPFITVRYK